MKRVPLAEIKDQLSKFLHDAETEEILITRHGKPAGILIGFESEDDWFDYRLENDPRFLDRIGRARDSLRTGQSVRLEDLENDSTVKPNAALKATPRSAVPSPRKKRSPRRG